MSTYPTTIRARATSRDARSVAIWAALIAALAGAIAVLMIAVPNDQSHPGAVVGGKAKPLTSHSRFDGGPNEGTRGALSAQQVDSPVIRFDGGPQEGTRGAIVRSVPLQAPTLQAPTFDRGPRAGHVGDVVSQTALPSPAVSSTRFDGGPNEGSRGAAVQSSTSTRFDGGPNEGTRGR
jgi:hypothetical protein